MINIIPGSWSTRRPSRRCGTCSSSRPGPSCARSRSAMATYTYDVHSLMTISDPTETIQQPWRRVTGTLGVSPRLIPPHSVVKSYTHLASLKYCYTAGMEVGRLFIHSSQSDEMKYQHLFVCPLVARGSCYTRDICMLLPWLCNVCS